MATLKAIPERARTRPTWRGTVAWLRHPDRFDTSIRSRWSIRSILSFASAGSVGSAFSIGSMLSVFSAGSILSLNSAGSILSINSVGSILSINSCGGILARNGGSASEDEVADGQQAAAVAHASPLT
jgi:hypothetical protein